MRGPAIKQGRVLEEYRRNSPVLHFIVEIRVIKTENKNLETNLKMYFNNTDVDGVV